MSASSPMSGAQCVPVNIEDEMQASYLDYAMSVIIGRALPDVRDGLKPVHRRVLYAMYELSNSYQRPYKKSARIVGDVIGKYHPHGDQSVYDTLVRLAQEFSMRHILVDGQGNFGSIDGDPPAAMRYTEVRMSRLANEMLEDIHRDAVDFSANYDDSLEEPQVLPAKFPQLLINGSSGIAVGMATNIPPHNLREVIEGTLALIEDPSLPDAHLLKLIPGPDFPTGGLVYGMQGLKQAYLTGRGVVQMRGRAHIEEAGKQQRNNRIVITEIPYQVNKTNLIEKIAELIREKRIEGISDLRDESNRQGIRIVAELKNTINPEVVLNHLYSNTSLQSSFGYNMLAIVQGRPEVLSLRAALEHFINHRRSVVTRRTRFELRKTEEQFNVTFGLLAAIDNIDRIITLIRQSKDQAAAKSALLSEVIQITPQFRTLCQELLQFDFAQKSIIQDNADFHLNEQQVQAILDMRLSRLTGLEREKLIQTARQLSDTIQYLTAILNDEKKLLNVIQTELKEIADQYGQPRRTELIQDAPLVSDLDLIPKETVVVTQSHFGYVKRNPIDLYQAQNRGGRGKTAATTREEDFVENIFIASSHAHVLVFTDKGKVYGLRVCDIPQATRTSKGKPLVNLIRIDAGESISAVLPVEEFVENAFVMMATSQGIIKKVELMSLANPRASGLIALSTDAGDRLIHVALTNGNQDIVLATRYGMAIRFSEDQVRSMGRTARGVRGITLKKKGDSVVGMAVVSSDKLQLLSVCENGYGKRTPIQEFRRQSRGGSGIIICRIGERNGEVASVLGIEEQDEIMVVTDEGKMMRTLASQISQQSREASGVRVMTTTEKERVVSVARIKETFEENSSS